MNGLRVALNNTSDNDKFYIMNKDRPIYEFVFETDNSIWIKDIFERPPFWIKDPQDWLMSRNAAKHRNDIKSILMRNDALTLRGFFMFTRGVSLTDTLWVKRSSDSVEWKDVSPYTNKFRGKLGVVLSGDELGGTDNPTLSTDGEFAKCWIKRDGKNILVKEGKTGNEPFADAFASRLRGLYGDVVEYSVELNERDESRTVCECFTDESTMFLPYIAVTNKLQLEEVLRCYDTFGDKNKVSDMLMIDCLTINCDRHYRNFGFMLDADTYEIKGMAPIFDMNYSFGASSLYGMTLPVDEFVARFDTRMFGQFLDTVGKSLVKDSYEAMLNSFEKLRMSGVEYCSGKFFERMVDITKFQIEEVNRLIRRGTYYV